MSREWVIFLSWVPSASAALAAPLAFFPPFPFLPPPPREYPKSSSSSAPGGTPVQPSAYSSVNSQAMQRSAMRSEMVMCIPPA